MTDVVRAYRQHYEALSMPLIIARPRQQAFVAHVMLSQWWSSNGSGKPTDRPIDTCSESAVGLAGLTSAKLSIAVY
jgi:hypothetical protein